MMNFIEIATILVILGLVMEPIAILLENSECSSVVLTEKSVQSSNNNKKRKCLPSRWTDNLAKKNRLHAAPYRPRSGVLKPGKCAPNNEKVCGERCRLPGCLNLDELRHALFQSFYRMDSWASQRVYLLNLIEREHLEGFSDIYRYFLHGNGIRREVCKKTWMDTFQIKRGVVETLQNYIAEGRMVITERRGQYQRTIVNDNVLKERIRAHINGFPRYENHYSREVAGDEYLSPELSVCRMFVLFEEANQDVPGIGGKEDLYRRVFQETGLKIGTPRSDTCKDCDRLSIGITHERCRNERLIAEMSRDVHQTSAQLAYRAMDDDMQKSIVDPAYVVLSGDMQQVLFTPGLTHSEMFYKRQLSSYNYCLYIGSTGAGIMNVWNETVGKRGVDEVGSCLIRYVRLTFNPLLEGETRHLVYWSDRCRGQTNNYMMLCLLKYLITLKYFTTIDQKFLTSGHSFLACDRMFALIEKRKSKCQAFVPSDWANIIRTTAVTNPFIVHEMTQEDIVQVKRLEPLIPRPRSLKVTEHAWFRMEYDAPSLILSRPNFLPSVWSNHPIVAPNQQRRFINREHWNPEILFGFEMPRAYNQPLPISREKFQDLMAMVPYLEPQYRPFYEQLRVET